MYLIGSSFGLLLLNVGGLGKSVGNCPVACVMAVCTSVAAASMLLSRLNCSVNVLLPWLLVVLLFALAVENLLANKFYRREAEDVAA